MGDRGTTATVVLRAVALAWCSRWEIRRPHAEFKVLESVLAPEPFGPGVRSPLGPNRIPRQRLGSFTFGEPQLGVNRPPNYRTSPWLANPTAYHGDS